MEMKSFFSIEITSKIEKDAWFSIENPSFLLRSLLCFHSLLARDQKKKNPTTNPQVSPLKYEINNKSNGSLIIEQIGYQACSSRLYK